MLTVAIYLLLGVRKQNKADIFTKLNFILQVQLSEVDSH